LIIQKFEKKIKIHRELLNPLRSSGIIEWSEEEIRQQEKDLYDHNGLEKKKERKENITNLFCTHRETREQNGFLICIRCNGKWRIKTNG